MRVGARVAGAPVGTDSAGDRVQSWFHIPPLCAPWPFPPPPPPPRLQLGDLRACSLVLFKFSFFFSRFFFFFEIPPCWSLEIPHAFQFPGVGIGSHILRAGRVVSPEWGEGLSGRDFSSWVLSPWETLRPGVGQIPAGAGLSASLLCLSPTPTPTPNPPHQNCRCSRFRGCFYARLGNGTRQERGNAVLITSRSCHTRENLR